MKEPNLPDLSPAFDFLESVSEESDYPCSALARDVADGLDSSVLALRVESARAKELAQRSEESLQARLKQIEEMGLND